MPATPGTALIDPTPHCLSERARRIAWRVMLYRAAVARAQFRSRRTARPVALPVAPPDAGACDLGALEVM